ncbi:MAG: hypothetical protein AAF742_09975, partial [Pseudomonadota bacterium]
MSTRYNMASARREDERRVARPGDENKAPAVDRRRKRLGIEDLSVPSSQTNMSAVRFGLELLDASVIGAVICLFIWSHYVGANQQMVLAPLSAACLGAGTFLFMMVFAKAYRFRPTETTGEHLKTVLVAALAAIGVWLTTALILRPETFLPDGLASAGIAASAALLTLHYGYSRLLQRLHLKGRLAPTVVMLGATESARRIIEENAKTKELNIVAIFDERLARAPMDIHGVPVVGRIGDLLQWEGLPYVNRIVVTLPSAAAARKKDFVEKVRLLPNRIAYVSDAFENLDHVKQRLSEIAEVSLNDITGNPKSGSHTALKRLTDIVIGSIALILLAIPLAIIALII